jgi:hypothetical protein
VLEAVPNLAAISNAQVTYIVFTRDLWKHIASREDKAALKAPLVYQVGGRLPVCPVTDDACDTAYPGHMAV